MYYKRIRLCLKKLKKTFYYSIICLVILVLNIYYNIFLSVIDSHNVSTTTLPPPINRIFFHETSGKGKLNSRQSCSVESAAKAHPNWEINVLFLGSFLNRTDLKYINALNKYPNIRFSKFNIVEYAVGTPLEKMIKDGYLNKSKWKVSHTSDAIRYLTLYKWGGVYLDLDVFVVKSFEDLANNWAARESNTSVAAGAMSFSLDKLGREVAEAAIQDFKVNFNGTAWGNNGPGVITRTLQTICKSKKVAQMSASVCKGFEVYGPELFYPISWKHANDYFSEKHVKLVEPYVYHVWNHITEKTKVKNTSLYTQLARKYCPEIYNSYNGNFRV